MSNRRRPRIIIMHKLYFAFGFLAAVTVEAAQYLRNKPNFLKPCRLEDATFEQCFASNFQVLFTQWKDGVPGLNLTTKLDPLKLKRVKIQQDSGNALRMNADLRNVVITGASGAVVRKASIDMKKLVTTVELFLPHVRYTADYKLKGQILALNLDSIGKAFFETNKALMIMKIQMRLYDVDEFSFTDIEKMQVYVKEIGDFRMHMDNLFGGQKELEDAANTLFNENWRNVFEVMRPTIQQTIEAVLHDRLKKMFNYVPASYFIANLPKAADYYK